MEPVSNILMDQTQDTNSIFTWLITCESYKSYIFCVVFHLEVEYTLERCIVWMTAVQILVFEVRSWPDLHLVTVWSYAWTLGA